MRTFSLLSARSRVPALIAGLLCWIAMALLGAVFAGARHPGVLDRTITHHVQAVVGQSGLVARLLVSPTNGPVAAAVIAVLMVVAIRQRRWALLALSACGPVFAVLIGELILKPTFDRFHYGGLSYPSGHTIGTVTPLTILLLVLIANSSTPRRIFAVAIWSIACISAALGLIAMDYHYPTDVLGGVLVSLGVALPGAVLVDLLDGRRRRPNQPPTVPAQRTWSLKVMAAHNPVSEPVSAGAPVGHGT